MATDLTYDELKDIYIRDLSKLVPYDFKLRSRVRHPGKWASVEAPTNTLLLEENSVSKTWVWSDIHFGHKNIIGFSERPYMNLEEMHEHLIANFNDYVDENDISIWVGDIAFMNDDDANALLDRCNGYKILVVGNHDFKKKKLKKLNFDEVHLLYHFEHPEVDLVFTHYPIEAGLPDTHINVHGHIHNTRHYKFDSPKHINVCCEFHDYKPVPLETIIQWAKMRLEDERC